MITGNSGKERPLGLPAWLARRPQYHRAAWLWWRSAARRWTGLCVAVLAWLALAVLSGRWSVLAARHSGVLAILSLLLVLSAVVRRRQGLVREVEIGGQRSWCASLPTAVSAYERITLVPLMITALLAATLCLGAALRGLGCVGFGSAAAVLGGACGGLVLALLVPRRALYTAAPPRRTLWLNRPLADTRASLLPLGHWPTGRKQLWARPKVLAWGSLVILMSLPMAESQGSFARIALGSVALWFIGHHLLSLLLALLATAFPAARWLAPAPLDGLRFAVFLGLRVWLKEAVAAIVLSCGALALDSRLTVSTAVLLVLAWAAVCVALAAAACQLARWPRVLICGGRMS